LILGPLLIALLAALCGADLRATRPGLWLVPLAVVLGGLATQEMLGLLRAAGHRPVAWAVLVGSLLPVLGACAPIAWLEYPFDCPLGRQGWLGAGLVAGLLLNLVCEMRRYTTPGETITNLAAASFSVLYVGGLLGCLIQLRLLPVAGDVARGGLLAMLSMVIVVKATDIGAYAAGRLFGKHRMAPLLSPGKTWEGAVGGLALGLAGALWALGPLATWLGVAPGPSGLRWLAGALSYGLLVSVAGIVGDLAESLLKRDAGVKDSSTWLPGFGGVLDLLDSLLVAAPVAYACWVLGLLGY
jgi:phosphatidate cytidylyltransferase